MKIKLDTLETKRQQYRKHLQRLTNIYHEQTGRKKILKQSRSVDKLLAITHRIHETSTRFRMKNMEKIQMESKAKDWRKVDCSFLPTQRANHQMIRDQKRKNDRQEIEKENKFLFDRLLKIKPTIKTSCSEVTFQKTSHKPFLPKTIKPEADFSQILNSSTLRPVTKNSIVIKLHGHNSQVVKISFLKEQQKFLDDENIYFLSVSNKSGKQKESACFEGKQLLKSQICIFRHKEQKIDSIELKNLANQNRVITKGHFVINFQKQNSDGQATSGLEFIFTNKKKITLSAQVVVKNLKSKHSKQSEKNSKLPQKSQQEQEKKKPQIQSQIQNNQNN